MEQYWNSFCRASNVDSAKLVRIKLQLKRKNSWLSSTTIATATLDCRLREEDSEINNGNLTLKTVVLDVYEPSSSSSLFSPGNSAFLRSPLNESAVQHLKPVNCLAFLFVQPQLSILSVSIEQNADEISVRSLQLGSSRAFGDIGFEYCGRDKKWLTTWSGSVNPRCRFFASTEQAGLVNVIQFGLRAFVPTVDIFFSEKVENLPICLTKISGRNDFPIDRLSPELICRIFSYIPTEFHLKVIFALSGTCRRLRQICAHRFFYKSVDLKLVDLNEAQLAFLRERAAFSLKSLRISHSRAPKTLILLHFNRLATLIANCVDLIDNKCLELICTQNANSLVEVDISYCKSISAIGFSPLAKLRRLRCLSVGSTKIDKDSLISLIGNCHLESLSIFSLSSLTLSEIDQVCNELSPELKCLDLSCSDRLTLQGLRYLALHCPKLEELNLRRCGNRNVFLSCDLSSCGSLLASTCPRLRIIGLPIFVSINDIRALGQLCHSLEEVYIHEIVDASTFEVRDALSHVINACPKLRYLTIRRHSTVDDAVDEEFCSRFSAKNVTITPLQW